METFLKLRTIRFEMSNDGKYFFNICELGEAGIQELLSSGKSSLEILKTFYFSCLEMLHDGFYKDFRFNICLQSGYSWRKVSDLHSVGISISPNPTDNKLTVYYSVEDFSTLKLYDAIGVEVFSIENEAQSNHIDIDVSKYPAGVYFCAMFVNGSQTSDVERVIILH